MNKINFLQKIHLNYLQKHKILYINKEELTPLIITKSIICNTKHIAVNKLKKSSLNSILFKKVYKVAKKPLFALCSEANILIQQEPRKIDPLPPTIAKQPSSQWNEVIEESDDEIIDEPILFINSTKTKELKIVDFNHAELQEERKKNLPIKLTIRQVRKPSSLSESILDPMDVIEKTKVSNVLNSLIPLPQKRRTQEEVKEFIDDVTLSPYHQTITERNENMKSISLNNTMKNFSQSVSNLKTAKNLLKSIGHIS